MAVRRESVLLEVDDRFTREILQAAAATKLLDQALNSLSRSATTSSRDVTRAQQDTERFRQSANQTGPAIDRLSGRLAIMAKAALVLGPALVPIGAVGVAGVAGLASQLGFAAIGMGSLMVATRGVGDALKAVNAAAIEPTAANLEKARAAMAGIGPEAREFVARFQELRPVFGDIRDAAARGWFPGLTSAMDDFERVAPRVASLFEAIGKTGGNLVAQGAAALAGPEWDEFLRFVEAEGPEALDMFGRSIGNVVHGLAELWMATSPINNDFSTWLMTASRNFDAWAAGLSETEGFQDFIEYVRQSGPQVGRTLGAIAEATVEIVKAASPLGGPVLSAFETIADTLKLIAESPVGTKIFTMAAAFVVLNKTLAITAGLLARTGLVSAGTAGKIRGAGGGSGGPAPVPIGGGPAGGPTPVPLMGRLNAAKGAIGQFRTDLAALRGATLAQRNASTSLIAAQARVNATMKQTGATALKAGAGVGAFAIATGTLGQGLGLQNTAMLGLVGYMAGPWGAAIGAGIGLVTDITAANRQWEESLRQIHAALASGDTAQIEAANEALKKRREYLDDLRTTSGVGDLFSDVIRTKAGFDLPTQKDYDELTFSTKSDAPKRLREISASFGNIAAQASLAAEEVEDLRQELANVGTVLTKQGQFDAYKQAIDDMTASVKENGRTLDANTEKGRANREALNNIAASAVQYSQNLQGMDRIQFLRGAIKNFKEAAAQAGGMDARARQVLQTLRALMKADAKPKVDVQAGDSLVQLNRIKAAIDAIRSKTVTINTIRQEQGLNRRADAMDGRAHGGYTGPGGKYEPAGIVHRGEVVIPQELVRRDRGLLLSRYGHLSGMEHLAKGGLAGYANGGRVGALEFAGLPAINLTAASLKELNKALRLSTKAIDKERSQREDVLSKMTDLRASVRGRLTSDLFGQTDAWTDGGGVADVLATLKGDIASGTTLKAQIAQLKKKGLDGGALADLLANADAATVANFAGASAADLRRFELAYEKRAALASSVGSSAATVAFGSELKVSNRQLAALNRRGARIEAAIREEHKHDRKSSKRGAGNSARNRKRG